MNLGADDFREPYDPEPAARALAEAVMRRNQKSLEQRHGPAGPELAGNKKYTVRRKGHDKVGFGRTLEMYRKLFDPRNVNMTIRSDSVAITIFAGPGSTDLKLNTFVEGQPERVIEKTAKLRKRGTVQSRQLEGRTGEVATVSSSGGVKKWKRKVPAVEGRDFVGLDQADIDAAASELLEGRAHAWGFR